MAAFQPWHPLAAADEGARALGLWLLHADRAAFVPCAVEEATAGAVRAQVEFYFSRGNLETDAHLIDIMTKRKDRAAPIAQINAFKRMRAIGASDYEVASAMVASELVAVSANGLALWPRAGLPQPPPEADLRRMAVAEHLPPGTQDDVAGCDRVRLAFARHGAVDDVRIYSTGGCAPAALPLPGKLRRSRQAFAVVTFCSEDDAGRAVAALRREEQRSGGWRSRAIAAALLRPRKDTAVKGQAAAAARRDDAAANANAAAGVTFRKPGDLRQPSSRGKARSRAGGGGVSTAGTAAAAGPTVRVAQGPQDGCGFKRVRSLPL